MPKQKTKRAAMKRFKRTGTGKLKRWHANHSHILTKKSPKRKRQPSTALALVFTGAILDPTYSLSDTERTNDKDQGQRAGPLSLPRRH